MRRNTLKEEEELTADSIIYNNGYTKAIVDISEYLFNTENHTDTNNDFYISPKYLEQTIKFLTRKREE